MSQQNINIGLLANDGTGDPLRTAFDKTQDNFTELYSRWNDTAWSFPADAWPTATAGGQMWYSDADHDVAGEFIAKDTLLISRAAGTGSSNFIKKQ